MSKNEDRTLSGSTEIYCDILDLPQTINAIRIKNVYGSAGMVLSKNSTTNKIEWSNLQIQDDTITTNMIQNLAVTNDKIANLTIQNGKIADATIDGTKLASNININTTGALTIGGITTLKGIVLFYDGATAKASYLPSTDVLNIGNIHLNNSIQLGSTLQADIPSNSITLGGDTILGGEVSMAVGGTEVFNMNSHNLTNGGTASFDTLNLGTALNMLNLNLNLGSGNLNCNDITCDNLIINNHTGTINFNNVDANNIDCVHLDTDRVKTDLIQLPRTGATTIEISPSGIETNGGYLDTDGGNLSMLNGNIIGANDIQCVNLDAGTIEGTTNLNGIMNVGYGAIDSITNNGQITGYGGSLNIRLDTGSIDCNNLGCQQLTTNGGAITCGIINSNLSNNLIYASRLHLSDTSGGLVPTTDVVYPTTIPIKQFDIYSSLNDIPRIIASKSFYADHLYTRSLNTTYKNIDKDTTTLNVAFNVPPSCKILVEVGMMARSNVSGQRLLCKLVNSVGTEFYTAYINDATHGTSTENTLIRYRQYADSTIYLGVVKFFLSFPTSARNTLVNLQPMVRVDTGVSTLYTGVDTNVKYPPMYVKVESLGSTASYNWHMETSGGGDDY